MIIDQLIAVVSVVGTLSAVVIGCWMVERVLPVEQDPGFGTRLESVSLFFLNTLAFAAISPLLSLIVNGMPSMRLLERIGSWSWIPGFVMLPLLTLVYALVWDFFQYWVHRAEHRYAVLWRFHGTHHNDRGMTSATSARQSAGGTLIGFLGVHLPTVCVLGFTGLPYIGGIVLFSAWGYYNHANARVAVPFLDRYVSGPGVHRLHHSHAIHLRGCNLAAFFTFYDRLFGTFVAPSPAVREATGYPVAVRLGPMRLMSSWLCIGAQNDETVRGQGQPPQLVTAGDEMMTAR